MTTAATMSEVDRTRIHASFLSLITGGLGSLLISIGMLVLIGGGGP